MTEAEVMEAIGVLTGTTTGWTDEAVLNYCRDLSDLDDRDVLMAVVTGLVRTWGEARRPPLSEIRAAYGRELDRKRQRERVMALPSYRDCVAPERGVGIAREAYAGECRRLGREPRFDYFDNIMAGLMR